MAGAMPTTCVSRGRLAAGCISFPEFVEIMTLGRADEQEGGDDESRVKKGRAPGRAPNAFNISLMASAYRSAARQAAQQRCRPSSVSASRGDLPASV